MTKVWCPCVECINNDKQRCKSRELKFKYRNMATVNEGRVDMWVCDQYQLSKESQDILNQLEQLIKKQYVLFNGTLKI